MNIDISENHTFPKRLRMFLSKDVSAGLDAKGRRELAASLSAYPVLAFHATRLLPHEEESIRDGGLVPLDEDFQIRRVAQAVGSGDLPPELGDRMLKGGRKLLRSQRSAREGRICFGVGRDILKTSAGGFSNLLRSWGGESLYGDLPGGSEDRAFVRTIGRPSMVVAQLDLTDEACMANYQWEDVWRALRIARIRSGEACAEVFYRFPVAADRIEAIWHPGDPEFAPLEHCVAD